MKLETATPHHKKPASNPIDIDSILFSSNKPSISVPRKGKCDIKSEEESGPFDEAREVERRRAPRRGSQAAPRRRDEKVAYVVFNGRKLGIFYNWAACEMSVIGFPKQRFKGYYTVEEAVDAWNHANGVGNIGPIPEITPAGPSTYTKFNHVISDEEAYWAVLQGINPGVYRGKSNAKAAGGRVNGRIIVVRALTEDEACRAFTDGYMNGRVIALPPRT